MKTIPVIFQNLKEEYILKGERLISLPLIVVSEKMNCFCWSETGKVILFLRA